MFSNLKLTRKLYNFYNNLEETYHKNLQTKLRTLQQIWQ